MKRRSLLELGLLTPVFTPKAALAHWWSTAWGQSAPRTPGAAERSFFCWRCNSRELMLTDSENEVLAPYIRICRTTFTPAFLYESTASITHSREEVVSIAQAIYRQMTGQELRQEDICRLSHHYRGYWGEKCTGCGHFLRTKSASYCCNRGCPAPHCNVT